MRNITQTFEVISKLNEIVRTTATSIEEQSSTTNEMAGNVNQAAELAKKTSEGTGDTNKNAEALSEMAVRLKGLVEQFKV